MPQYNEMFELSVDDMNLIETALRRTTSDLSQELLVQSDEGNADHNDTIRRIQELLGRLHDQKIFYSPKNDVHIGG